MSILRCVSFLAFLAAVLAECEPPHRDEHHHGHHRMPPHMQEPRMRIRSLLEDEIVYTVVIDAGSTGSRVIAYEFQKRGDTYELLREDFHQQEPGLSSYAEDPEEGAKKIMELLTQVDGFVPEEAKPKTTLYLRATAGLRLLGEEVADQLLQAVQNQFNKSGYKVEHDAAGLLSGSDEGLFAWFTVNYLKGSLDTQTYAALDLGGGSAQVTYQPESNYVQMLKKDMHPVPYKDMNVFSKSYLGLGINAARNALFEADSRTEIKEGQSVFSKCLHPQIENVPFIFNNKQYFVSGRPSFVRNRKFSVNMCKYYVLRDLIPLVDPRPLGLSKQESVAVSSFYYRGLAAQLITGPSGKITVAQLWKKAQEECAVPNQNDPFLCMDLIYMHTLLKTGYGLNDSNDLEMILKLDDHELSWALGFAYSKLVAA